MKIVILDFSTGEVTIEEVPEKWKLLDGDDIISEMGYRISDVHYMIVYNNLNIQVNTKDCTLNIKLK